VAKEERVKIAEPTLQCREALAARPGLDFANNRRGVGTEDVKVNVGAIAAIPGGA
jgi:hypothetical protein